MIPTPITKRGVDLQCTGANINETVLTPAALRTRGLAKLFELRTPSDARGCEAQPLYVPTVTTPTRGVRDLIILADMANDVAAFDAHNGEPIWRINLGKPIQGSQAIDEHKINDHWGILSTPVIDLASMRLYAVAWSSPDGSIAKAVHSVHVIDITRGNESSPPLSLEGVTAPSFIPNVPSRKFSSSARKQRCSLLLVDRAGVKTVFIGAGSVLESGADCRGWIIAVGTNPFAITAAWSPVLRGQGGGIWQAGAPLVADADGFIYAMTSNGDFDGASDFGESFVKLRYQPPAGISAGSLSVVDWWTPWTDEGRQFLDVRGTEGAKAKPTNFRANTQAHNQGWWDQDLGSGGPVVIESLGAVIGAGKDGVLFTVRKRAMGKTKPDDLVDPSQNYAKLLTPPIWWTYYPGVGLDPAPQDPTALNVNVNQTTHHQHGSPIVWQSAAHGLVAFCMGENGNLRAWKVSPDATMQFLASSDEIASPQARRPPGGMPGGMLFLSANGQNDGVLWAQIPYGDANETVTPGRLIAYDAQNFVARADGSMRIVPVWDSQDWGWTYSHNKFNLEVVADGRVMLPTYDGSVWVLGLPVALPGAVHIDAAVV